MGIVPFACSIAFFAGIIDLLIGFLRLGMLVDYISSPTIAGFTTGAAISTQISQLPSLFGIIGVNNNLAAYRVLLDTFLGIKGVKYDIFIGLGLFLFLYTWRYFTDRLTANGKTYGNLLGYSGNAIGLVLFSTIAYTINHLHPGVIRTFGYIPSGLSYVQLPTFTHLTSIIPASATIVLVALIEHIAITKSFGRQNGYKIDPNQEVIALGFINSIGSLFGGFPTTGSFSRSAVQSRSGVQTPLAGIVTGLCVLFSIYFLTGIFAQIPTASLASIICFNLMSLISSKVYLRDLYKTDKTDFVVFMLAFWVTMFTNIQTGIYASVAFSVAVMMHKISRPTIQPLLKEANGNWVTMNQIHADEMQDTIGPSAGIAVFRIEESVTFSSSSVINEKLFKWITSQTQCHPDPNRKKLWCEGTNEVTNVKYKNLWPHHLGPKPLLSGVVLDMSAVNSIDCTGLQALIDTRKDLERHAGTSVPFYFAHVRQRLERYINQFELSFNLDQHFQRTTASIGSHSSSETIISPSSYCRVDEAVIAINLIRKSSFLAAK